MKRSQLRFWIAQLRNWGNKEVSSGKILWRNHLVERITWEAEADMESRYPHLFPLFLAKIEVSISLYDYHE